MSIKGFIFILPTLLVFTEAWLFLPKKEVCYPVYGCFKRHPNGLVNLPQSPSRIGIRFNLFTRANRNSAKLIDDHHQYKLTTSHFKISRRTIFVIHGFTENINTWATELKNALLRREDCNVILVDWSKGAKGPLLRYGQAAGNTRLVGAQTAELIRFLISTSSGSANSIDRFYIVGFSLGAQVAGYAGSYLSARGMRLGRITGLDPAGLYFTHVSLDLRLDKSDASYVDVIHTNAGVAGTIQRSGHIDFYPNGGTIQPGCLITDPSCSHSRATQYFIASVHRSCSLTAYPCDSYLSFSLGSCRACNGACSSMGFDADRTKRTGEFYLTTNCGTTK
ncbi:inactive pancreatic lipase-related protein 1-like isoform X2 [Porites lutea]|uniref:inactive pancreatic lipase-related protein 1-like isoform X2 n=1 Tax=Porites lutea TaxID=51062 RepID=UPI003CC684D5